MADVFCAHASADTDLVSICKGAIEDSGHTHFFAEFEMEGKSLPDKLRDNIRASKIVIVLWTRNVSDVAKTRDIVNAETGEAHMASKPVFVFREEGTDLPQFVSYITDYITYKSGEYKNLLALLHKVLDKLGKGENGTPEEILFDGTVEVDHDEALPFTLAKGDIVEGIMKEKNRQAFDCYIMTEKNYAKSCSDRTAGTIQEEFLEQSSYHVKWKAPRSGLWYFDFDNYGKQYPRKIQVRLRRIRSAN